MSDDFEEIRKLIVESNIPSWIKKINHGEIDISSKDFVEGFKIGNKQGALQVWEQVLDKANRTFWDNKDWQMYAKKKIKELS